MRKIVYFLAVLGLTMTVSCGSGNNSAQREQEVQDSIAKAESLAKARQDSIAKVYQDSIVKAREDSIVKVRQDSIARRTRVTPDMAFLNVHGPVKTVKDEEGKTWEFTPEGKLKIIPSGYSSNGEGYIVKKTTPYDVSTYKYNGNMQLSKMSYVNTESGESSYDGDFSYNKQGFISSFISKGCSEEDVVVETARYNYTKVDKYGNWTSRSWTLNVKESGPYIEKGESIENYSGTEQRTITYYE